MPLPRLLAVTAVAALSAAGFAPAAATTPAAHPHAAPKVRADGVEPQAYIVVRKDVVRTDDVTATAPGRTTAAVRSARAAALGRLAQRVGANPRSLTTTVLPSFTAQLTADQVRRLAADPEVAAVRPVHKRRAQAVGTPAVLGLTGSGTGSWTSYGGQPAAGKGVVVGVVDTGIWPEAPTFTNGVGALSTTAQTAIGTAWRTSATGTAVKKTDGTTFTGDCSGAVPGHTTNNWSPSLCNQAIVSARAFPPASGWVDPGPGNGTVAGTSSMGREFSSPRDSQDHGTHVSATAAGRRDVLTYSDKTTDESVGVAPGASLAMYKACWTTKTDDDLDGQYDNYCWDDSLVAAVDRAVADGVDVLNFSISGTTDDPLDPVEMAMLGAAEHGVVVIAAGGNTGSAAGTVNHPSPWVLTVANGAWDGSRAIHWSSGRGPAIAYGGSVLKPDITAPGTDVLAPVPPAVGQAATTRAYAYMTGTSMASPHAAGLAALLLTKHPAWSPMMVRSAMQLTAQPMSDDLFARGSGYANAASMAASPFVMNATPADYDAVARSYGYGGTGPTMAANDLNQPTIALDDVAHKNATGRTLLPQVGGVWKVTASLPGYDVKVSPRRALVMQAGRPVHLSVSVKRTTAATGAWAKGTIVLSSPHGTVRLPLAARTR